MSEVTHLNPSQSPKAAETLAQAFGDDPVYAYIFPNPDERLRSLRRLWQALITTCLRYGEVYATPTTNGVACWLPPGRTEMSLWRTLRTGLALPRAVMSFERNAQRRAMTVFSTMDRVHAAAIQRPHWYLWVIGVHPASQGHGIGHSLLQPVLVKADAANLPCYLETQNESNVAFYRKRGFEVATVETPPDLGLTVWTMIREARQTTSASRTTRITMDWRTIPMWNLPATNAFTSEHARTLQELQITERAPGPILHDFDMLLAHLQDQPVLLTASHQLPLSMLPQVNARLAHPIQIDLKRPLQKTYPPIHGLYLILRASGLTYVGGTVKKPVLLLDADIYQDWLSLNPAERYVTLLEAWLLRGKPEIVGDRYHATAIPENYWQSWRFYARIPDQGLQIRGDRNAEELLPFPAQWHNLGLLELFGFIDVVDGPPDPGRGRRIDRISRTPVGDALLALLGARLFDDFEHIQSIEVAGIVTPGLLQPILQPYLPRCQRTLAMPEWAFRQGTHIFNVQLGQLRSRIALPAHDTLDDLADTILDVLDFDSDHLYEFMYRNRFGAEQHVHHPFMDEGPWTSEVEIGQLPLAAGQTMLFVYDFGDWWTILLTLEAVSPDMVLEEPQVLDTHGKPPIQYPDYGWE